MAWLGLDWDEGPFYQTQRYDLYREHAYRLLETGGAYKCYCTPEELECQTQTGADRGQTFWLRPHLS
jgi:glutamyl-tRNA synthetase